VRGTYQVASSPIPMLPNCFTDFRCVKLLAIGEIPGSRTLLSESGFAGVSPNTDCSHPFRSTSPTSEDRSFKVFHKPTEWPAADEDMFTCGSSGSKQGEVSGAWV
jgi:hypothetical protein